MIFENFEEMVKRFDGIARAFNYEDPFNRPQLIIRCRHGWSDKNARFYASFEDVEVKGRGVLIGAFGDGSTPEEAMEDYLKKIMGKVLVYRAMSEYRKEVAVV